MENIRFMGIKVTPKVKDVSKLQAILTMYGNIIRTRLGLNEECDDQGNRYGIIILELTGNKSEFDSLQAKLRSINGLELKTMEF